MLFRADRVDSMHTGMQGMSIEIQRMFTSILMTGRNSNTQYG